MDLVCRQQFVQSVGESLVVHVREDVVDTTVLKQVVLDTYTTAHSTAIW